MSGADGDDVKLHIPKNQHLSRWRPAYIKAEKFPNLTK
jgi:hypothetical protein